MAFTDYNSSQPIRTESDPDQLVATRITDATDKTKQAKVDADSNLHVLAGTHDPAGVARSLRSSELGALTPDGIYDAANNTKPGNAGLVASQRSATPSDTTQTERLTSVTSGTTKALDISLHDAAGAAFTTANPLPVTLKEEPGTEVIDYDQGAATAASAAATHTYTVTAGKTLRLKALAVSASGKAHFELAIAQDGITFVVKAVLRVTSSNNNAVLNLAEPIDVAAAGKVRITKTNQDKGAEDLDSTIIGLEV